MSKYKYYILGITNSNGTRHVFVVMNMNGKLGVFNLYNNQKYLEIIKNMDKVVGTYKFDEILAIKK